MSTRGAGAAHAGDDGQARGSASGRDESDKERRDRQLDELLQELRVMQTGVQVLFAFLLTLPFTQRYSILDHDQRTLYFTTLLAAGAAVLFLLAPGAWHRALFAQDDKAHLVRVSHHLAIVGLGFVGLATCGVIGLIATVMYPGTTALLVAAGAAAAFLLVWVILPLRRRLGLRHGSRG